MDYSEELWENNGNSIREDASFLTLTPTEIQQINNSLAEHGSSSRMPSSFVEAVDPNSNLSQGRASSSIIPPGYYPTVVSPASQGTFQPNTEATAGVGVAVEGATGIYHFQGSLLSSSRNELQLQAFPQSGPMTNYAYSDLGSSVLPQPPTPSMPFNLTGTQGVNQAPALPTTDTINFLDRDMPPLGQRLQERVSSFNLSGSLNQEANQVARSTASFLGPGALDPIPFTNSRTMPNNVDNHSNIGAGNSFQFGTPNSHMLGDGHRAYSQSTVGGARTWLDLGQANTSSQPSALNLLGNRRPIMNSLYDPIYEQMGLPVDPHLRFFLAEQASKSASTSNKRMR